MPSSLLIGKVLLNTIWLFYYFQKPDHEQALELLQQAEFDDVIHNLIARKMMLPNIFGKRRKGSPEQLAYQF